MAKETLALVIAATLVSGSAGITIGHWRGTEAANRKWEMDLCHAKFAEMRVYTPPFEGHSSRMHFYLKTPYEIAVENQSKLQQSK
jgi:hypothetical protein